MDLTDIGVAAFLAFLAIPALYLLWLAFRKPPPVVDGPKHWSRWVWYALQAVLFFALVFWMVSDGPMRARPGVATTLAAALTFYLVFAVQMYIDLFRRLFRAIRERRSSERGSKRIPAPRGGRR